MDHVRTVTLAHADDWHGFRLAARSLLRAGVAPEAVNWRTADDVQGDLDLFGRVEPETDACPENLGKSWRGGKTQSQTGNGVTAPNSALKTAAAGLRLPRALLEALPLVILHRAPERLHCLYRLLWRWQREPALRHDPLDPDMRMINNFYREVRHDASRMLGFVRFRPLTEAGNAIAGCLGNESVGQGWRVAWYEPRHRVLRLVAPHFARRFPRHCWAILTPDACVSWDMAHLAFYAGVTAESAPSPDAGEALWLTYYANHFNAARRNPKALLRCMPADYWKNLPESGLISALLTTAG